MDDVDSTRASRLSPDGAGDPAVALARARREAHTVHTLDSDTEPFPLRFHAHVDDSATSESSPAIVGLSVGVWRCVRRLRHCDVHMDGRVVVELEKKLC